jgi:D-alanine-D-alanine ligase
MIVTAEGTPFVHEVNSIPGMTEQSDLPAEAAAAGISFDQLVLKILESAF